MPDQTRIREIREQLNAIAPCPEDGDITAAALGRYLAVAAQERWAREMSKAGTSIDPAQLHAMCAEFAAAHALFALHAQSHAGPELGLGIGPAVAERLRGCTPAEVAAQIRDAWMDGGSIGEWLYEHLGEETITAVSKLTAELDAARADAADTAAPAGRQARVEVKGFRDLGIVRITETTLAGEPMLHAEKDDGSAADFPASSVHFITWIPDPASAITQAPELAFRAFDEETQF
jgi:hypothetical protein